MWQYITKKDNTKVVDVSLIFTILVCDNSNKFTCNFVLDLR